MPFSQSSQVSTILDFALALDPASVLDVGTGMGQYGFLLRTNLENEHLFDIRGAHAKQRDRSEWKYRIDGIEGYDGYLTPVHAYAYQEVMIGNALEVLPRIADRSYELVIAIDILEHLTTEDGARFLDHCVRIASKAVLVSTPKEFHAQEIAANPYENHRSVWSEVALREAGFLRTLPNAESWVVVHEVASI